jgi:15-cis-phytoene synthase
MVVMNDTSYWNSNSLGLQSMEPSWEQRLFNLAQEAICFSGEATPPVTMVDEAQMMSAAERVCEAITAQHSRSFYLATSLLPIEKRRAMRVLYAFCRTADDLADGDVEQPMEKLLQLREGLLAERKTAGESALTAWA